MRGSSKSGLFLMELIIAIAFFAVASAICIQLFAKAHILSAESSSLHMAVSTAQSAAACFKSTDGSSQDMARLLSATVQGDTLTAGYDADGKPAEDGQFQLTVQLDTAISPATATIVVTDTTRSTVLYQLVATKYLG